MNIMTVKGVMGYADVENLEEAVAMACCWEYPHFTFEGKDYKLTDGTYLLQ